MKSGLYQDTRYVFYQSEFLGFDLHDAFYSERCQFGQKLVRDLNTELVIRLCGPQNEICYCDGQQLYILTKRVLTTAALRTQAERGKAVTAIVRDLELSL